ncbi:hypothetical protein A3K93_09420 [Acinetobacter sp. NCu2D-2]|uniref:hypothetical protein n=1 Tax=Acinetobacter sp. NCu2D-2 TaxID=1608473 RepID=UPI0007CDEB20|nr:hypothetical protein [Acinetobacter sp. NCu2D-2]ANF82392.1 hypothetical protein A3K93_09420 [Acinetobacter sp. NCu2D-2]
MKFALEINYPHHKSIDDAEQLGEFEAVEILKKFNTMNWKQLQILQLQMQGSDVLFTVTNTETEHSLQIKLNALSPTHQLEFSADTDIEIEVETHNLFGLLKMKRTDYVAFEHMSLQSTQNCLTAFLNHDIQSMINEYQAGHATHFAATSRA